MELKSNNIDDEEQVGFLNNKIEVPEKELNRDPDSHKSNKSCPMKTFACLGTSTKLIRDERRAFYVCKKYMNRKYLNEQPKDQKRLEYLCREYFDKTVAEEIIKNGFKSDKWGEIGFQGKDPRTDFRGSGFAGLDQLCVFFDNNEELFQEMAELTQKGLFMLACNSISVTFFIKEFFHMGEHPHLNKKEKNLATRRGFKNFCTMLNLQKDLFHSIHEMILTETFKIWKLATSTNPSLTIMDVKVAEDLIRNKFKKDICGSEINTFGHLRRIFMYELPEYSLIKKRTF